MRYKKLQEIMTLPQILVTDPVMIYYFIGKEYDPGERLLALLIQKDKEPLLFLNKLFIAPDTIKTISYEDSDNPINLIKSYLAHKDLGIDGTWAARFVIPFIHDYDIHDASATLESLRRIKDNDEIELMTKVSEHNDRIMEELKHEIRVGMTEIELADIINTKQNTDPLEGVSFTPIALFSENIADPHGIPSNRKLTENDMVLIDMGGMYKHYASDMTRCFLVGSKPELEKIYEICRQANEAAIAAIAPGVSFASIDKAARDVISDAGYGEYFVHRTGHGIGLEAHENLDVSSSNQELVQIGMCFSIEPGIYIPGVGGVRVEDLVCVSEHGVKVLNHYTKSLEQIVQ
ncbi:aminopeptidase P family protein [Erysipelothrix sp. HDW6A]|uniref:M24 family metallopeptidase n=1 Tax=Erysipelothrix sp. HDW6A TaxID=2714928 RepID=UPI0014081161|nr:Xaa-Pro peptidase family protein [Erysipelothrix sp. HDW6A]QIK57743.1 aminopeptidase P family protein [Erysipelothrix sp. HDW6A]